MMKRLEVLDWVIEVDVDATRAAYNALPAISCTCLYCRNYVAASSHLAPEFLHLCDTLGLDPVKAAEVYELCRNRDGTHLYGGFYHLVARILQGADSSLAPAGRAYARLAEHYAAGFTEDVVLVPAGFPEPVLQLEFDARIPWVLEEKATASPCEG
ncbi:MAG: hypothetical protein M3328_09220 [Chloroflexota bacterium]|nr:hypothetical protein [Chloroflexota bacterium]